MAKRGIFNFIVVFLLAGLLPIVGCGESRENGGAMKNLSSSLPEYRDIPDCEGMAKILVGIVSGLTPSDDDELGRYQNDRGYGVSCVWLSPSATDASPFEAVKGGSFGVTLNVDQEENFDENQLRKLGMIYDDPRIQSIGGYIVDLGKGFDPAGQVGSTGPLVVVGHVSISFSATGLYLQNVDEMRAITNDRAITGAVKLHRFLTSKE